MKIPIKFILHFAIYIVFTFSSMFLILQIGFAQQRIYIQGVCIDSDNNLTIANVHLVNISNTKKEYAVSSSNGYFQTAFSKNDTIKVSCLGYETIFLKITKEYTIDTLKIFLSSEYLTLAPAIITSKKNVKIYQDEKYSVLDFLLDDEGIKILAANHINKKYFIRQYNYENKKIAELYLDFKPQDSCFKDYQGRTFIFDQQENTYQFWKNKQSFEIKNIEIGKKTFLQKISGYHFQFQDKLFTTIYNHPYYPYMCIVQYYEQPENNVCILKSIYNKSVLNELSDPFVRDFAKIHPMMLKTFLMPVSVYAPVFKIKDTILLFDHTNCEINIFNDSLQLLSTVKLTLFPSKESFFSPQNTWIFSRRIIQDEKRFFALFQNNSGRKFQLWEIDYLTGQILKKTSLDHPCPKHIQVKHDRVYYIYKELASKDKYGVFMQILN